MHDRYYATPPADFTDYRWRLLLLAEERVGAALRQRGREEDAAWAQAQAMLGAAD